MYIYMYVCLYMCMYICMYIGLLATPHHCSLLNILYVPYMHICSMHICIHIYMYIYMYVSKYICIRVEIYMYICLYICMFICMYKYAYTSTCYLPPPPAARYTRVPLEERALVTRLEFGAPPTVLSPHPPPHHT